MIDVLSFTTTLTVAADNSVEVFPYPFGDESAQAFARRHDAVLAVGRDQARQSGGISLSAATVRAAENLHRLVLPSPNGSAIAQKMSAAGAVVLGVALRNVEAAVSWATTQLLERPETALAVVAAGERWPDGSLRPAVEDLWGAGAFLAGLARRSEIPFAPDATAAAAAYVDVSDRLPELVWESVSGRNCASTGTRRTSRSLLKSTPALRCPYSPVTCSRGYRGMSGPAGIDQEVPMPMLWCGA